MPKRATIVNAVSGSPGGLNQSSVTTRHAESPEDMSARVREAALSQRKSTSDYERRKVFQRYHDRDERADKRRGRQGNKLLQPISRKDAMKELGDEQLVIVRVDIIHTGDQDARFHLYLYRVTYTNVTTTNLIYTTH